MSSPDAVVADGLGHAYVLAGVRVQALRDVDLRVHQGESVALLGSSGSGKSTLLGLVAGLQRPGTGSLTVLGRDMAGVRERELLALRAREVGVVFQNPGRNVLGHATALDNLLFAQRPGGRSRTARRERAADLLDRVGLTGHSATRAGRLSGGEQQRLAVAVGLVNGPRLLLADEPTSQLDTASGVGVVDLLVAAHSSGAGVVVVTHDPEVAARMDRTVRLVDGRPEPDRYR